MQRQVAQLGQGQRQVRHVPTHRLFVGAHSAPAAWPGLGRVQAAGAVGAAALRRPQQQQQQQQRRRQRGVSPPWQPLPPRARRAPPPAAAAAAAAPFDGGAPRSPPPGGVHPALASLPLVGPVAVSLAAYVERVGGMWRRFVPMLALFFCLSFTNTILDSLKDTLVITAAGGGASVVPFLTVYAVLPSSLLFLVAYSWASQRMSRAALFNAIVIGFSAFFAAFGAVVMPNADALHLHAFADSVQQGLPAGLAGAVGMLRNWTYTLFFCAAELWGDVCMGLLFWGLANDTTSLQDAPTLYPLFGLGANIAQAMAGLVLKATTAARATGGADAGARSGGFTSEVQTTMGVVVGMAAVALAVHHYITISQPRPEHQADLPPRPRRGRRASALAASAASAGRDHDSGTSLDLDEGAAEFEALIRDRLGGGAAAVGEAAGSSGAGGAASGGGGGSGAVSGNGTGALNAAWRVTQQQAEQRPQAEARRADAAAANGSAAASSSSTSTSSSGGSGGSGGSAGAEEDGGKRVSLRESFVILASSLEIRCLAIMSLAQGLCTSLMEFVWKSHMRLLFPSPSDFTAFLGDVALWTGAVTASLMLVSPLLFERLGWRGVASTTPQILLFGGSAFFGTAIAYQHWFGASAAAAAAAGAPAPARLLLGGLVVGGALLYVFSKASKFSLFKPAEEMVYITLDEAGRTRGKAAIDVVGSQTGKSGGSILQQALLLMSAGAMTGPILPILFGFFYLMLRGWKGAVRELSSRRRYTLNSPVTSMDEDDWPAGDAGGGTAVVRAPPRPAEVRAQLEAAELAVKLRDEAAARAAEQQQQQVQE